VTELTAFLASVYDAFSEAEMQALQHGQARLAELLESGTVPEDVSVPVYHASEVRVNLDVGLVAEETEEGMEVFVTEADENASELDFGIELFELLEKEDLEDIEYDRIFPESSGVPPGTTTDEREYPGDERDDDDRPGITGKDAPPIEVIDDIEPRYRTRLEEAGIERLSHLLELSPEELAETLAEADENISTERAADWLSEARGLASLLSEQDADLPVELVDGVGPTFGNRLREAGLGDLSEFAAASPEDIAEHASTADVTVSADRAASWLERADAHLTAMESGDQPELNSEVDRIDADGDIERSVDAESGESAETGESEGDSNE